MKLINDKNGDRLGLLTLLSSALSLVMCLTLFAGTSWAWFYDTATCAVEDIKIKTNLGTKVNVTVTEIPAVSPMLLPAEVESTGAEEETEQPTEWTLKPNKGYSVTLQWPADEVESTGAEEETEQPTEWTLEPDKSYYVTLQWPADENVQTEGYCVITIGSSQYRTEVFSDPLSFISFICYTTGMEYPVVMKIDGFLGTYEATDGEEIILDGGTIGKEPAPAPTPEATASPEPTPTEDPTPTAAPTTEPAPEPSVSPESTPTEAPTPTAAPTTEPAPETSVSPESTPTEAPTPTTENAGGQEQSEAQTSAPASQG